MCTAVCAAPTAGVHHSGDADHSDAGNCQETLMFVRRCVQALLLLCLGSTLAGCGNPSGLDSVQVTPTSQSLAVGQTSQFTAYGTFGNAARPTKQNITSTVTWSSATPGVATVSATGMVAAVSAGTTTITAEATAFNGLVSSSAQLTVTGAGGGQAGSWRKHPFADHHSERDCRWQFAGQRPIPGDRNLLRRPDRERPDQLGQLGLLPICPMNFPITNTNSAPPAVHGERPGLSVIRS